jgi:hypothetical protein
MLKSANLMKDIEVRAAEALKSLLEQVPAIKLKKLERATSSEFSVDILAHLNASGRPCVLACEVEANGQPRFVRIALLQLRDYVARLRNDATPILIAPYISPDAQALCRANEVGFLDFEGNARIVFDGVFIERVAASKPPVERRQLRSMFKSKSARVLSVMLLQPNHAWRVAQLSDAAGVSLGHVSNVRAGLLAREWGRLSDEGLSLSAPDALLDAWRDVYVPPQGERKAFYTTVHGRAFEDAARRVLNVGSNKGRAIFASFSAGHWLVPYGRTGTQYFYADDDGAQLLESALALSSPARGENVVIAIPKDEGVFANTLEPAPGAICTSLVQTYLDLAVAGERGREAANHLRHERLRWANDSS